MTHKLSRGSLSMIKLTVPLAMEQFFRILVSSVDTFMLSTFSEQAVAGVGLVGQYVFFIQILFNVVCIGASIVLAQYLGAEKSDDELNYISQASSVMITVISLILTAVVILGIGPLLNCYTLADEVRNSAYNYFVIFGGYCAVFTAFSLLQSAILRSYGYTRDAMIVTIVANLINVGGNALALYTPFFKGHEVEGVAWASGASMIISCIILQIMIVRKKDVKFSLKGIFKVPSRVYHMILKIGIPTAGENLSYNVANIMQTAMFSTLGTEVMSAHVYTQTIIRFAYALSIAIGGATQIKTGYYVGAKQSDVAYKKLFLYWMFATISSVSLVGVLNIFKTPIISLFTKDTEVTAPIVATLMLVSFYIEFGRCMNLIFVGGLKGSGDIKFPVVYGIFSMWSIIVGLGWFLGIYCGLGIVGFWLAVGTEETTRGIAMVLRWRSKRWMKHAIV